MSNSKEDRRASTAFGNRRPPTTPVEKGKGGWGPSYGAETTLSHGAAARQGWRVSE